MFFFDKKEKLIEGSFVPPWDFPDQFQSVSECLRAVTPSNSTLFTATTRDHFKLLAAKGDLFQKTKISFPIVQMVSTKSYLLNLSMFCFFKHLNVHDLRKKIYSNILPNKLHFSESRTHERFCQLKSAQSWMVLGSLIEFPGRWRKLNVRPMNHKQPAHLKLKVTKKTGAVFRWLNYFQGG